MFQNKKVKIINGEHKGKSGVVTGMFWACNTAIVRTDDGEEIAVKIKEIKSV